MTKQPRGRQGIPQGKRALRMTITSKNGNAKMIRDAAKVLALSMQFLVDHVIDEGDVAAVAMENPPRQTRPHPSHHPRRPA
jgi:hypothetical protein